MYDDVTLPDGAVRIPLRASDGTVRAYAIVDAADAAWVNQWRWSLGKGYAARSQSHDGRRVRVYLHRELLGLPRVTDGRQGDHIDRDKLNCRRVNLRVATHAQNLQNKASYRGSTSRYRGVCWVTSNRRWRATVRVAGKLHRLGEYLREEDAAAAARAARLRLMPYTVEEPVVN